MLTVLFAVACAVCLACMVFLGFRLSKVRGGIARTGVKRSISLTFVALLICVMCVGVSFVFDPVRAEARNQASRFNTSNYALVQSVFEYSDSPFVLTLGFRGAPLISVVHWQVGSLPEGVWDVSITRVNGQDRLAYVGMPPQTEYVFNITAVVMEADQPLVTVPLVVRIYNGLAVFN